MSDSVSKPGGVSMSVLVLSLLLAVAVTTAVMFALRPAGPTAEPQVPGLSETEPVTQSDSVRPGDRPTGTVYYPIPFASPPNLKLTAPGRVYEIIKQDELGFVWTARLKIEDFPSGTPREHVKDILEGMLSGKATKLSEIFVSVGGVGSFSPKPDLVFEEFTWEAKGIRVRGLPPRFQQRGSFTVLPNTEGEEVFKVSYTQPAHVELLGNSSTVITECRTNGFKWKSGAAGGKVEYIATGLRVTDGK